MLSGNFKVQENAVYGYLTGFGQVFLDYDRFFSKSASTQRGGYNICVMTRR
jgi:hypothetical protein